MQSDLLLQEWKLAKQTCQHIVEICKMSHLGIGNARGKIVREGEKQTCRQFMDVYNIVYRLCMTKEKEENRVVMVYRDYKQLLKTAILDIAPLIQKENFIYRLDTLKRIWDCFADIQKRLNHMFSYLNRPFHIKEGKVEELDKTATNTIITTLFLESQVTQYDLLYFKEIDQIRKTHNFQNSKILCNFVDIFYQIHLKIAIKSSTNKKIRTIYTQLYSHYQKISRQFYQREYKQFKKYDPSVYFQKVFDLYMKQKRIADTCFVITAENLFNKEFSEELVISYKQTLLNSQRGLKFILKQGQIATLKLIVDLYMKLTKSLDGFKEQFQEYIYQEMKNFMEENKLELSIKKSIKTHCSFIQKINRKNEQLLQILQSVEQISDFSTYYKSGIQKAFLHSKLPFPIEQLLATYADTKLKQDLRQKQLQQKVRNIIIIFNCAQNKDLFLLKYTQKIAKRLLSISESSLHNNEVFISNLKLNCGIRYTESVQTLITEYKISLQHQQFLNQIIERQKVQIGINLKVFSEGAWPIQTVLQIPIQFLPQTLQRAQKCINIYRDEFNSKKSLKISSLQSKIRWIYFFDQSDKPKIETCYFQTNVLQAALIYHIYRSRPNKIPIQFLQEVFNKVAPKLLKENLNKMSDSVDNILIKIGEGQEVTYQFNRLLVTNKKILNFDQGSNQQQQKLFQQNDLGKDREAVIDANISKLMKSKKVMDYRSIFEEVTKMVRVFVPQPKDIKKGVQRLIGKYILERDEKDKELLRYKD